MIKKKSKDILRASNLPLLPKDNIHVKENLKKVNKGKKLSPILLVRDSKLIIADGYHRVCAIYYLSEDLEVPCRITDKTV
jgi:disulfide oxidoreductase YuzD